MAKKKKTAAQKAAEAAAAAVTTGAGPECTVSTYSTTSNEQACEQNLPAPPYVTAHNLDLTISMDTPDEHRACDYEIANSVQQEDNNIARMTKSAEESQGMEHF
jgi:hypothetical protein